MKGKLPPVVVNADGKLTTVKLKTAIRYLSMKEKGWYANGLFRKEGETAEDEP